MQKVSGIYSISGPNKGLYIGSAVNIPRRCQRHRSELNKGSHHSIKLQRAWGKYGEAAFEFKVLEHCESFELLAREQHYLDTLKPKYNVAVSATSPMKGRKHKTESKLKMGKAGELNPFYGKSLSAERKAELNRQGTSHSPETLAHFSESRKGAGNSFFGKKHTEETKQRIAEKARLRKASAESKLKRSIAMSGSGNHNYGNVGKYKHSEVTRAKISVAGKGKSRPVSEATREKLRASALARSDARKTING